MDMGNPIEIINPGNGLPDGSSISPMYMACEPYREGPAGPGGGCGGLNPPSCPPKDSCGLFF